MSHWSEKEWNGSVLTWWHGTSNVGPASETLGSINMIYEKKTWAGGLNEEFTAHSWDIKTQEMIENKTGGA